MKPKTHTADLLPCAVAEGMSPEKYVYLGSRRDAYSIRNVAILTHFSFSFSFTIHTGFFSAADAVLK
jgi:hypothetical protein